MGRLMQSSLARHQHQIPADEPQLFAMRRAAWQKEGIAVFRLEDLTDDYVRQVVINEANRRYGTRHGKAQG